MQNKTLIPKETLEFFEGDDLRSRVFIDKYALRDASGKLLEKTPVEMQKRVAKEIASVEKKAIRSEWEKNFYWLLKDFKFIPGGRIMYGAGQNVRASLLNCYVIPIENDSLEAIFEWCKEAAKTYSFGGGVGVDIGNLRPKGAEVNNSARYSTGAVSFMELFSTTTGTIGQAGRRGALIITIPVDHPDIEEFIRIKQDNLDQVRFANISVRLTDKFMNAVKNDEEFTLKFDSPKHQIRKQVKARDLWDKIVGAAHKSAEPGLIFWDTMRNNSPTEYGSMKMMSTNPCSEIPLEAYGCCCLGNVNLSMFVKNEFNKNCEIDWLNLEKTLQTGVRFLDNVLDYNADKHALEKQKKASLHSRRIGVGFTGLGDMLAKMQIRYDSPRALEFIDQLFEKIKNTIYEASIEIGKEKGVAPGLDIKEHLQQGFIKSLNTNIQEKIKKHGIRNCALITIPPVGSGAILAGTTSGVEPIFACSYKRRSESLSEKDFKVYHPLVAKYMKKNNIATEEDLPDYFVTSHKISPNFRVDMQATLQKHIDHSISSTVNLPSETGVETVKDIYMRAWEKGCKGITVYREGSREGILTTNTKKQNCNEGGEDFEAEKNPNATSNHKPHKLDRERILHGKTIKMKLLHEVMYLTVNTNGGGRIREVFVNIGKSGGDEKADSEAVGRLISLYLQNGGTVTDVIKSLKGIKGKNISFDNGKQLFSVPDAIAKGLEILGETKVDLERKLSTCPDCHEDSLVFENGCFHCTACGYTKCG